MIERLSRLRYLLLGLAAGVLLSVGAYIAVAGTTAKRASDLTRVKIVDGYGALTSSNKYVTVPGATEKISVPPGEQALLIAHFTASSRCIGDFGPCAMRVMVNDMQADPSIDDVVYNFAFDSAEPGDEYESHATHRSLGPLPPGSYRVKVQIAVEDPDTEFDLGYWSLIIERVEV